MRFMMSTFMAEMMVEKRVMWTYPINPTAKVAPITSSFPYNY